VKPSIDHLEFSITISIIAIAFSIMIDETTSLVEGARCSATFSSLSPSQEIDQTFPMPSSPEVILE
jgi:hypothetical protein